MPQVIAGPIALAAFNAGVPLGVANAIIGVGTAGAILHGVVSTALVLGASYAVAKLTAPKAPRPSDGSLEFKQPLPVRFFTYGLCKVSGPQLFFELSNDGPDDDRDLLKIVAFGTRELDAFVQVFSDRGPFTLDGSLQYLGWSDDDGDNHGALYGHLGAPDQTYDVDLASVFSDWTSAHRLRGIPYIFALFQSGDIEDFQRAFPNNEPQLAIVGGVKVYDPLKDTTNGGSGSHRMDDPSTWEFSDNAALCLLDWLTWPDGYNKSWDRIDWPSWLDMINLCDEDVDLKAGGTEKRYRVATKVSYDEPRSRVLHRLLQAMDGHLYTTADGLIGIRGGRWEDPTVSLDVSTMPEAQFTHGVPMMDRVNEFQLSAMLPTHDYSEVDLKPWINAADPEHIAGLVRRQPLDLTQVPSNAQAQRLAKIYMAKANPRWSGQVRTRFDGLGAWGQSVIALSNSELDVPTDNFNGPFFINGKIAFLPDKTGVTFPVSAADPTGYDWDPDTEEQDAPALPA